MTAELGSPHVTFVCLFYVARLSGFSWVGRFCALYPCCFYGICQLGSSRWIWCRCSFRLCILHASAVHMCSPPMFFSRGKSWGYMCRYGLQLYCLEMLGYWWAWRTSALAFASKYNDIMMLLHDSMCYRYIIIHQYHMHDTTIWHYLLWPAWHPLHKHQPSFSIIFKK
jgi:hypothetical protein